MDTKTPDHLSLLTRRAPDPSQDRAQVIPKAEKKRIRAELGKDAQMQAELAEARKPGGVASRELREWLRLRYPYSKFVFPGEWTSTAAPARRFSR